MIMSNIRKKRRKLEQKIAELEAEVLSSLTKKSSAIPEINLAGYQIRIANLRKELNLLK